MTNPALHLGALISGTASGRRCFYREGGDNNQHINRCTTAPAQPVTSLVGANAGVGPRSGLLWESR